MLDRAVLLLGELGAAFASTLRVPGGAILLIMMGVGLGLLVPFMLSSKQGAKSPRGKPIAVTNSPSEVAKAQAELRELVREFSRLAEQVLRALDSPRVIQTSAEAQGKVLHLLGLGLAPNEVARATNLSVGEVALLMNLNRAQVAADPVSATSSVGGVDLAGAAQDGNGGSAGAQIEAAAT
jgi:hypothetical protein